MAQLKKYNTLLLFPAMMSQKMFLEVPNSSLRRGLTVYISLTPHVHRSLGIPGFGQFLTVFSLVS